MFHDNWKYAQLRHEEMLKQAQAARLESLVAKKRFNRLYQLILVRLGVTMVAIGRMLHKRYAPAPRRTYLAPASVSQPVNTGIAEWYRNDKDCQQPASNQARSQARFFSVMRGHKSERKKPNR